MSTDTEAPERAGDIPLDHPDSLAGDFDAQLQAQFRAGERGEASCAALGPVWPARSYMCTKPLGHHKTDDEHQAADGDFVLATWPVVPDPATLPKSKPAPLPRSDQAHDVPEWSGE